MIKKNGAGQTILGAILGAALLGGTAVSAHAERDDRCERDVHRAEQNLDKAIRKHGGGNSKKCASGVICATSIEMRISAISVEGLRFASVARP